VDLVIPIIQAAGQMGGMGLLAAALFALHREALKAHREDVAAERKAFREELAAERKQNHDDHGKILEAVNENTTAIRALANGRA
jgi:hypothetical protein